VFPLGSSRGHETAAYLVLDETRRKVSGLRDDWRSDFATLLTKRGGFMASLIAFDLLRKTRAL
jgi:hypothetical protein